MKKLIIAIIMITACPGLKAQDAVMTKKSSPETKVSGKTKEVKKQVQVPVAGTKISNAGDPVPPAKGMSLLPLTGMAKGESLVPLTDIRNGNKQENIPPAKGMSLIPLTRNKNNKNRKKEG